VKQPVANAGAATPLQHPHKLHINLLTDNLLINHPRNSGRRATTPAYCSVLLSQRVNRLRPSWFELHTRNTHLTSSEPNVSHPASDSPDTAYQLDGNDKHQNRPTRHEREEQATSSRVTGDMHHTC
jgi:hypothetical protein